MSMFLCHVLIFLFKDFQQIKQTKKTLLFIPVLSNSKYPHKNTAIYVHLIKMKNIYICFQALCLPKIIHERTVFKYL